MGTLPAAAVLLGMIALTTADETTNRAGEMSMKGFRLEKAEAPAVLAALEGLLGDQNRLIPFSFEIVGNGKKKRMVLSEPSSTQLVANGMPLAAVWRAYVDVRTKQVIVRGAERVVTGQAKPGRMLPPSRVSPGRRNRTAEPRYSVTPSHHGSTTHNTPTPNRSHSRILVFM